MKTIIKIFWVLFSRICLPIFCLPAYLESFSQVFNLHKQSEQSGWTNKVMQKNISYIYLGMENVRLCVCLDRQNESSKKFCLVKNKTQGWEPWSSGYGTRLMFQRSWVRILALYTGRKFFTFICYKNCNVCLKRQNKLKGGRGWLI